MPKKKFKPTPAGLTQLRPTTWPAVYQEWYRQEGRQSDWGRYLRQLGYSSWREWREDVIVKPFRLTKRTWMLYRVTDPRMVLDWYGGPFPSWQKAHYRRAQTRSFAWLVKNGRILQRQKIKKFNTIPKSMKLFGFRYRNRIVVLDGMHRCCALAIRVARGQAVKTKIIIALAATKKLSKLRPTMV